MEITLTKKITIDQAETFIVLEAVEAPIWVFDVTCKICNTTVKKSDPDCEVCRLPLFTELDETVMILKLSNGKVIMTHKTCLPEY